MKEIFRTELAPSAIGPYSQGTGGSGLIFVSGQLPLDPVTGVFAEGGIEGQTRRVLMNIKSILEAAGTRMENVLKTTVFLKDMADFTDMNGVYKDFFSEGAYPARSAVQIARLPRDARIEIEAIAIK